MSFYGQIVNGTLQGVIEANAIPNPNPQGFVLLANWAGWTAKPSRYHVPTVVNGALQWQDIRTSNQAWAGVRAARDSLLTACDWRATKAVDRTEAWALDPWKTYREALRNIPQSQNDPFNITWPTPPG